MDYIITITAADGTERTAIITANGLKAAHEKAAAMTADGENKRVYFSLDTVDGIARAALLIAKKASENACKRMDGGTATQRTIRAELSSVSADIATAERAGIDATAEKIMGRIAELGADSQDFFAAALHGLTATTAATAERYRAAYRAINAIVRAQRAATVRECSLEYITDGGGDIVAYNDAIAAIIRGGEKWTPTDGGKMTAATAAELGRAIHDAMATLNAAQRRIIELTARGYSQRQIATMTGRELATVNRNIAIARAAILAYLTAQYPQFAAMIDGTATATAAERAAHNGDRTAAARMRAYRARKAAERAGKQ